MKWNFRKIVVAAAVMQLGCFCTAAAGELSNEKIRIIDEIVNTKIKEAKGADALSEVLDAVAAKFPLDTDKDSPEYSAYMDELQEQVRKKYPATNQELERRYQAQAERNYPLYNPGDHASVIYLLHGEPFTVSGQYYRQDSRFVWIGSKKILKSNLATEFAPRFDSTRTKQLRAGYVTQHLHRYQQERGKYLIMLKARNKEKILELRGEIKFNGKWVSPRKVVMEKYAIAFARQDRLIAESIQKAVRSSDYNEKDKILEAVIQEYSDHKEITAIKALQERFRQDHINSIIANAVQQAMNVQDYNEKLKILEAVIQKYPDHKAIPGIKALQERFKQERVNSIIANAIQQANEARDYNEKYKILEAVIQKYPDHKAIAEAKKLLQEFKTAYVRKSAEIKTILAYCSQPNLDYKKLEDEYKINLSKRDILSQTQKRFLGIPGCDQLQNLLRGLQLKMFQMSRDAVNQLAINSPGQKNQLIIRKKINVNSNCRLLIFPIAAEDEVMKFYNILLELGRNWNTYKRLLKESENLALKATRLENERKKAEWEGNTSGPSPVDVWQAKQDSSYAKLDAIKALKQAKTSNGEALLMLVPVSSKGRPGGGIQTDPVSLSNVKGPIILLAWEQIDFGDGFEALQGWYKYFIPSGDTQEWILE